MMLMCCIGGGGGSGGGPVTTATGHLYTDLHSQERGGGCLPPSLCLGPTYLPVYTRTLVNAYKRLNTVAIYTLKYNVAWTRVRLSTIQRDGSSNTLVESQFAA